MKLTRERFQAAKFFIQSDARELDKQLFALYFEAGPPEAVTEALGAFRNSDGGFGHGLESDVRLPASSTLATTIAFQTLRKIGATKDHPFVKPGIEFFLDAYDQKYQTWTNVPEAANDYPHAPWWNVDPGAKPPALINENGEEIYYAANPSAEVTGYLNEFREFVPPDFLKIVTTQAVRNFEFFEDPIEVHTLLCYLRTQPVLPDPLKTELGKELIQRGLPVVPQRPSDWETGYVVMPHEFVRDPTALFARHLRDSVIGSLQHGIAHQDEDGSWKPSWNWGMYEEEWKIAEKEIAGTITVEMLRKLTAFGLVE